MLGSRADVLPHLVVRRLQLAALRLALLLPRPQRIVRRGQLLVRGLQRRQLVPRRRRLPPGLLPLLPCGYLSG